MKETIYDDTLRRWASKKILDIFERREYAKIVAEMNNAVLK